MDEPRLKKRLFEMINEIELKNIEPIIRKLLKRDNTQFKKLNCQKEWRTNNLT